MSFLRRVSTDSILSGNKEKKDGRNSIFSKESILTTKTVEKEGLWVEKRKK